MKKAVTGGLQWTILVIIIGLAMVALFWLFLSGVIEEVPIFLTALLGNFKVMIRGVLGPLGWILGW